MPEFWLGLMLILVFAVQLGWLPTGGFVPIVESPTGWLRTILLPALTLGLVQVGFIARMTRASMLEALSQDFVRTADAKGLSRFDVVVRHGLPNALIPILTVIGIVAGALLGGTVIIEQVFSIPGVGRLIIGAIAARDFPVMQGGLLFLARHLSRRQPDGRHPLRRRRSAREADVSADAIADTDAGTSPTRETLGRLLRHRSFLIGGAVMLVIAIIAAGADWLAPFDPLRNNFRMRLHAPDAINWFGTDHFGRDILSRIMFGARTSLIIGAMVVVATGICGTIIGATAGYFPRLDQPLMRLMDALMAFPSIVLAMVVSAIARRLRDQRGDRAVDRDDAAHGPHRARLGAGRPRARLCRGRARARRRATCASCSATC